MHGQQVELKLLKKLQEKKTTTDQRLKGKALPELEKNMGLDLSKELQKTIDILLKPEHSQEQIPYQLSKKPKRLKKKRQSL